jgi:predicted nucleic acid-binding protein
VSRIYWDTMLFVYFLEDHPRFGDRVAQIWSRMKERKDELCTASLTLGEILVAPYKRGMTDRAVQLEAFFADSVDVIPFTVDTARRFARIRASLAVSSPDAVHLACAAQADTDLFLTNDVSLIGKVIPGIQFIAGLNTDLL